MEIEYDAAKAAANVVKRGVAFDEAITALFDPLAVTLEDGSAQGEPRWVVLGMSTDLRLLVVVHTVRGDATIRLISARTATRTESRHYARQL